MGLSAPDIGRRLEGFFVFEEGDEFIFAVSFESFSETHSEDAIELIREDGAALRIFFISVSTENVKPRVPASWNDDYVPVVPAGRSVPTICQLIGAFDSRSSAIVSEAEEEGAPTPPPAPSVGSQPADRPGPAPPPTATSASARPPNGPVLFSVDKSAGGPRRIADMTRPTCRPGPAPPPAVTSASARSLAPGVILDPPSRPQFATNVSPLSGPELAGGTLHSPLRAVRIVLRVHSGVARWTAEYRTSALI